MGLFSDFFPSFFDFLSNWRLSVCVAVGIGFAYLVCQDTSIEPIILYIAFGVAGFIVGAVWESHAERMGKKW